jgi:hypothetical protein
LSVIRAASLIGFVLVAACTADKQAGVPEPKPIPDPYFSDKNSVDLPLTLTFTPGGGVPPRLNQIKEYKADGPPLCQDINDPNLPPGYAGKLTGKFTGWSFVAIRLYGQPTASIYFSVTMEQAWDPVHPKTGTWMIDYGRTIYFMRNLGDPVDRALSSFNDIRQTTGGGSRCSQAIDILRVNTFTIPADVFEAMQAIKYEAQPRQLYPCKPPEQLPTTQSCRTGTLTQRR